MERLSTEILVKIFSLLDLSSVGKLKRTSSLFHEVFVGSKAIIIPEAVKNHLELSSLREILAITLCLQVKVSTKETVLHILDTYFSEQHLYASFKLDVPTAMYVYQHQGIVKAFIADFSTTALSFANKSHNKSHAKENPQLQRFEYAGKSHIKGDPPPPPPTPSELQRFQRNFWKFELYCHLFRDYTLSHTLFEDQRKLFPIAAQKAIFLDKFAPWENEQLGCIYEYLWKEVSRVFNDVAAHDIAWGGGYSINWVSDCHPGRLEDTSWKDALLSRGLAHIMAMKNAQSYDERYRLVQGRDHLVLGMELDPRLPTSDCLMLPARDTIYPDWDREFLVQSLLIDYSRAQYNAGVQIMEDLTTEEVRERCTPEVDWEPDCGPFDAWESVHGDFYTDTYFNREKKYYRKGAYVMWDGDRVARRRLLASWVDRYSRYTASRLVEAEKQRESQEARKKIYEKGGRGWWSFEDQSCIQWPEDLVRSWREKSNKEGVRRWQRDEI